MNPITCCIARQYFLYDADTIPTAGPELFDIKRHQSEGRLTGVTRGRGATWLLRLKDKPYVMRHYQRGGWIEKWLEDRYIWSGLEKTRAFREWRLLARLHEIGLPAPQPLAARVVRHGIIYRGDLITHRIPDTRSLAEALEIAAIPSDQWEMIGRCIRRFHDAGVYHADLNAHNILLDRAGKVYLIDFDRGAIGIHRGRWKEKNLQRLGRSFAKLSLLKPSLHFSTANFAQLESGYARS